MVRGNPFARRGGSFRASWLSGLLVLLGIAVSCGESERRFGGSDETSGGSAGSAGKGPGPAAGGASAAGGDGNGAGGLDQNGAGGGEGAQGGETGEGGDGASVVETSIEVEVVDAVGDGLPGVPLVASDATGAFARTGVTDDEGRATLLVPSGGSVSALRELSYSFENDPAAIYDLREIITAFAVPDGGAVRFSTERIAKIFPSTAPKIEVEVGFTGMLGATSYSARLSCGSSGTTTGASSLTFLDYRGCGTSDFDLYAVALDSSNVAVGYALFTALPFEDGAYEVTTWETGLDTVTLSFDELPESPAGLGVVIHGVLEDRPESVQLADVLIAGAPEAESVQLAVPSGVFDQLFLRATFGYTISNGFGIERYAPTLPSTISWQESVARVDEAPTLDDSDPARPQLAWTLLENRSLGDVLRWVVEWAKGSRERTQWIALHPPSFSGSARFPELPDSLSAYRPTSQHSLGVVEMRHVEATGAPSYAGYLEDQDRSLRLNGSWSGDGSLTKDDL